MSTSEAPAPAKAALHPVFRAVAATVVPESTALDDAGWRELESLAVDALGQRPLALQRKLHLFLRLVQWLPLLRYARPFTRLDVDRRTRFLGHLQEHRLDAIRVGFWGLRTLVFLGYYGRAAGAREIGYRPHLLGWSAFRG